MMRYQQWVAHWMHHCFGPIIPTNRRERGFRFLEEALELVQTKEIDVTQHEAHQLVDYVYGRPVGQIAQEVGGVIVTLTALCNAVGADMEVCGDNELQRCYINIDKIRAKQAAKRNRDGALP